MCFRFDREKSLKGLMLKVGRSQALDSVVTCCWASILSGSCLIFTGVNLNACAVFRLVHVGTFTLWWTHTVAVMVRRCALLLGSHLQQPCSFVPSCTLTKVTLAPDRPAPPVFKADTSLLSVKCQLKCDDSSSFPFLNNLPNVRLDFYQSLNDKVRNASGSLLQSSRW